MSKIKIGDKVKYIEDDSFYHGLIATVDNFTKNLVGIKNIDFSKCKDPKAKDSLLKYYQNGVVHSFCKIDSLEKLPNDDERICKKNYTITQIVR